MIGSFREPGWVLEQGRDGREEFGKVCQAAVTKWTGGGEWIAGALWKQCGQGMGRKRLQSGGAAGQEGG